MQVNGRGEEASKPDVLSLRAVVLNLWVKVGQPLANFISKETYMMIHNGSKIKL